MHACYALLLQHLKNLELVLCYKVNLSFSSCEKSKCCATTPLTDKVRTHLVTSCEPKSSYSVSTKNELMINLLSFY